MNYDDLILVPPKDFRFRPACGHVEPNGVVVVSGCHMKQHDIDTRGRKFASLMSIFREIDEEQQGAETTEDTDDAPNAIMKAVAKQRIKSPAGNTR